MTILCWNVRGLNKPNKHDDFLAFLYKIKPGLVGLLETKVKAENVDRIYTKLFDGWESFINNMHHPLLGECGFAGNLVPTLWKFWRVMLN